MAVSGSNNRVVLLKNSEVVETTLQEDEVLVPLDKFNDFVKPHWTGTAWEETATEAEIREYKKLDVSQ